jgi:hypothetical protein
MFEETGSRGRLGIKIPRISPPFSKLKVWPLSLPFEPSLYISTKFPSCRLETYFRMAKKFAKILLYSNYHTVSFPLSSQPFERYFRLQVPSFRVDKPIRRWNSSDSRIATEVTSVCHRKPRKSTCAAHCTDIARRACTVTIQTLYSPSEIQFSRICFLLKVSMNSRFAFHGMEQDYGMRRLSYDREPFTTAGSATSVRTTSYEPMLQASVPPGLRPRDSHVRPPASVESGVHA